jgi:TRAP-type uncharacterized transport system fused permease subunit
MVCSAHLFVLFIDVQADLDPMVMVVAAVVKNGTKFS